MNQKYPLPKSFLNWAQFSEPLMSKHKIFDINSLYFSESLRNTILLQLASIWSGLQPQNFIFLTIKVTVTIRSYLGYSPSPELISGFMLQIKTRIWESISLTSNPTIDPHGVVGKPDKPSNSF